MKSLQRLFVKYVLVLEYNILGITNFLLVLTVGCLTTFRPKYTAGVWNQHNTFHFINITWTPFISYSLINITGEHNNHFITFTYFNSKVLHLFSFIYIISEKAYEYKDWVNCPICSTAPDSAKLVPQHSHIRKTKLTFLECYANVFEQVGITSI